MMKKTLIIAEAGVNHNGDLDTAMRLVDAASEAGADYVKFQTFKADKLAVANASLADYQRKNTDEGSQLAMLRRLELSHPDHLRLIEHCRRRSIKFLSTAFDLDSVDFLHTLSLDLWKIPSGEITNFPYLRAIAKCGGKAVMSTGMCAMADIEAAIDTLTRFGIAKHDITLLHCNTEYPTPMEDVNLAAMAAMRRRFGLPVGYSDHTAGIEVPIAAVALGATVIEKHFTLDRAMQGPDHKASLDPAQLKAMVRAIRNVEIAVGSEEKKVSASEAKNMAVARKSIVAARKIKKGEILSDDNLTTKRPGSGISPMMWEEICGQRATRDYMPDEQIDMTCG